MPATTDAAHLARLEKAREIRQRIQNGEKIPVEELVSFLHLAEKSVFIEVKKKEKPTDVDFF